MTFCVFFTSFTWHNVLKVHTYCITYLYFIPLCGQIIFNCMDLPPYVYPFIGRCMFELFPLFGC